MLTLGERECSIQRRHQKLIEESPSPGARRRDARGRWRTRPSGPRARSTTGTRAPSSSCSAPDGSFFFIELNARLQVEHPVSELVTGIDLVREQLRIAAGESSRATGRAERRGHAIEVRINAEDPARDFLPVPGRIERFRPPLGPGVRVDTHIEDGAVIPPNYDSLLAKVIVWDADRPAAIDRCLRALAELEVVGVPTTKAAAIDVLRTEEFASGRYSTGFLEEAGRRLPALARLMSGRRAARRTALFLLYQWDVTGQPLASLYEGEIDPFARELAEAVVARADELDAEITEASEGWPADRLGALERNVLRIGIHELEQGEVPVEVAIDEAVTLAKRYASDEAGAARERDPRPHRAGEGRMSAPRIALTRAEELLERLEQHPRAARGDRAIPRPRSTSSASSPRSRSRSRPSSSRRGARPVNSARAGRAPRADRGLPRGLPFAGELGALTDAMRYSLDGRRQADPAPALPGVRRGDGRASRSSSCRPRPPSSSCTRSAWSTTTCPPSTTTRSAAAVRPPTCSSTRRRRS